MADLSALDALVRNATSVRITENGHHPKPDVIVDLSQMGDRDVLRTALAVDSLPDAVCACAGDVRFEFLDAQGEQLTVAVLHHGVSLRWNGWRGDAFLTDGRAVLRWLDEHGMSSPLERAEDEAETRRRRAVQDEQDDAVWVAAMPPALADLAEPMLALGTNDHPSFDVPAEARQRLWQAVPDPVSRVLQLFAWYAVNAEPKSGYRLHDLVPGKILADVPLAEIVAALQHPTAEEHHFTGALRHLLGRERRRWKRDIGKLPTELKLRLREEARETGYLHDRAERLLSA